MRRIGSIQPLDMGKTKIPIYGRSSSLLSHVCFVQSHSHLLLTVMQCRTNILEVF